MTGVKAPRRLFLVRHGEAEGNLEGRYLGWEDAPLTAAGRRQAALLAERLAGEPLRLVISSDLARARETAAAIAGPHHLAVQVDARWREANFGVWSGLTYGEIHTAAPDRLTAWLADPERQSPPGGETLRQVRERALAALPRRDGALLVSHGGTLRALLAHWTGRSFWDLSVPPASLTVVVWTAPGRAEVLTLGEIGHLGGNAIS